MLCEYSSASERMCAPCQRISPCSGAIKPQRIRNRLVFPLPFGPVSCRNPPSDSAKLTLLKSRRSPRTHRRLLTSKILAFLLYDCPGVRFIVLNSSGKSMRHGGIEYYEQATHQVARLTNYRVRQE